MNFNPRSHERSDHYLFYLCQLLSGFQSTLPREERPTLIACVDVFLTISIHAPTRGATISGSRGAMLEHFNPRSHERSDRVLPLLLLSAYYFNPRSHERSDLLVVVIVFPTCRFQSTLPREERLHGIKAVTKSVNFNPRSHERSDLLQLCTKQLFSISIHAPTRGATSLCLNCGIKKEFQSTLPREERR